jgi:hypothetical protein
MRSALSFLVILTFSLPLWAISWQKIGRVRPARSTVLDLQKAKATKSTIKSMDELHFEFEAVKDPHLKYKKGNSWGYLAKNGEGMPIIRHVDGVTKKYIDIPLAELSIDRNVQMKITSIAPAGDMRFSVNRQAVKDGKLSNENYAMQTFQIKEVDGKLYRAKVSETFATDRLSGSYQFLDDGEIKIEYTRDGIPYKKMIRPEGTDGKLLQGEKLGLRPSDGGRGYFIYVQEGHEIKEYPYYAYSRERKAQKEPKTLTDRALIQSGYQVDVTDVFYKEPIGESVGGMKFGTK